MHTYLGRTIAFPYIKVGWRSRLSIKHLYGDLIFYVLVDGCVSNGKEKYSLPDDQERPEYWI